jgi:hypothetical protein
MLNSPDAGRSRFCGSASVTNGGSHKALRAKRISTAPSKYIDLPDLITDHL